jgi:nuclear transcription factor Y alpha
MTMHSEYLKENDDSGSNSGSTSIAAPGPWWSGLGTSMENQKQSSYKDQQRIEKVNATHQFTIFPDDCKNAREGRSYPQVHATFSVQSTPPEYRGCFELGFGQQVICAKYPYGEQCYGVFSAHGPQITGRVMLPLNLTTDDGPIYVNAKQYHGILRRRQSRAKAELINKALRNSRKPYLHLSRHLHAMRRPRGCGGRFLNTKKSEDRSNNGAAAKDRSKTSKRIIQPTMSQNSEVVQSENNSYLTTSPIRTHGNTRLGGSEVTSMFTMAMGDLNQFPYHDDDNNHNRLRREPSILSFSDIMNTGHAGNNMVMPTKWIAAGIPSGDTCCNLTF